MSGEVAPESAGTTEDRLYGGRISVRQPARGYRTNVDTILLAASVAGADGTVMEAGCGVGAALLVVARRFWDARPAMRFLGVEQEAAAAQLARDNAVANGMSARMTILTGDVLAPIQDVPQLAGAFFNPPYDSPGKGRAPLLERRAARIERAPLNAWIRRLADRLAGGAWLTLIHRADRLAEVLAAMEGRLGGVEILPIRPHAHEAASRVIVRGRKGSRAPLSIAEEIILHDRSGAKYTARAEAILRGDAALRDD